MNLIRKLFRGKGGSGDGGATGAAPERPASPLGGEAACEEVSLHHVWSDAPDALKFQVDRNLLALGEKRSYASREQAADAPLAQALFDIGGIAEVSVESAFLTVTMAEEADWDAIMREVPHRVAKFFRAGGQPFTGGTADGPRPRYKFGFRQIEPRSREEQMRIVQELFENEVNPAVAAHGGYFTLLDVRDNNVYVELGGGCQGCGMANVTLRQGVEARLKEALPEMAALIDTTDHAAGQNPYYQPGKK